MGRVLSLVLYLRDRYLGNCPCVCINISPFVVQFLWAQSLSLSCSSVGSALPKPVSSSSFVFPPDFLYTLSSTTVTPSLIFRQKFLNFSSFIASNPMRLVISSMNLSPTFVNRITHSAVSHSDAFISG